MNYNNQLNHLRKWCLQKTDEYYTKFLNSQGAALYLYYLSTIELEFKLTQLTDLEFANDPAFYERIITMMDTHYDYSLKKNLTRTETFIIEKVKKEFLHYVQEFLASENRYAPSDLGYQRVITSPEADTIISQINSRWEYYRDSYWFPLMGDEPKTVSDKFFIMKKHVAPYWNEICNYIFKENNSIYSYGESHYDIDFCIEISSIDDIEREEWTYTDKKFNWFIYFSHEDTVSFAGTLVPVIKEILQNEKEHWDHYEYPEF